MSTYGKRVLLAAPRGYCAGVERAVEAVERALTKHGAPVYVRKQIVHNLHVVHDLEAMGAVFVEELDEVPEGAVAVLSAHGSPPTVFDEARGRGLELIDATCPLVTKVHVEARRFAADDRTIVLIGHAGHEEVEGTSGQAPDRTVLVQTEAEARVVDLPTDRPLAYLTQTTLSVDETSQIVRVLQERYPTLEGPPREDICYATQNRQDAVKLLAPGVDILIVVGSPTSSNSNRLRELAERLGTSAYMVDQPDDLQASWFEGRRRVGLTAGASAPDILVQQVIERLRRLGAVSIRSLPGVAETTHFPLPMGLGDKAMAGVVAR